MSSSVTLGFGAIEGLGPLAADMRGEDSFRLARQTNLGFGATEGLVQSERTTGKGNCKIMCFKIAYRSFVLYPCDLKLLKQIK